MVKTKIILKGMVQGVGFRHYCFKMATALGLLGYAKNLYNGDVELEVEGDDGPVNEFVNLVKIGPEHSRVTSISVESEKYENLYTSFSIY
ncbi:MAG: acylphosphatase [Ignavibacteriota bacterium]|nr:acylphosphatase [Ignavibacteriota bacterium]